MKPIILIKKLPIENSPPRMSIHWAEPWVNQKEVDGQIARRVGYDLNEAGEIEKDGYFFDDLGKEHDESSAMRIIWNGDAIRVYDDEYRIVTDDNLYLYTHGVCGDDMSHLLRLLPKQEALWLELVKANEELSLAIDAGILDGFHPLAAHILAIGIHEGLGWFECAPEYAAIIG